MRTLAQQCIDAHEGGHWSTLGIGAAYRPAARSGATWIGPADETMYAAKRAGRNKAVFAA